MAGIDCEYWTKLDLWLLEDACLLASGEDPITYRLKPRPPNPGLLSSFPVNTAILETLTPTAVQTGRSSTTWRVPR